MARRKRIKNNPVGDSERFYQKASPLGQKGGGGRGISTDKQLRKDGARAQTLHSVSKYPDILDIYAMIDGLTKEQIKKYAKTSSYDVLSRDLLFHFAEDWGEINRDHNGYLSQVPDGYDELAASLIGDLLYWMITGANERSIIKSKDEIRDTLPWSQEIKENCPNFAKRMESFKGLTIHDLRGLQIRLLNNLPINSYNRYTIAQATQDDPELAEQFFPKSEPLSADEHQTLTTLRALIEEGDIEKFSVALAQSSESKITRGNASMTFEAFEMAKQAIDAYKRGEVEQTRMRLTSLINEYGMNLNAFQSGLKDMFVLTASAPAIVPKKGGRGGGATQIILKGSPSPLLVSLDTSMEPKEGWKRNDMHSIMKFANQHSVNFSFDKNTKRVEMKGIARDDVKMRGTLGLTAISASSGKDSNQSAMPTLTTNWTGIFDAAIAGRNYSEKSEADKLAEGIDLKWPNAESISLRFVIHADLSKGIGEDYLVPKALLTVVARQGTNSDYMAGEFKLNKYGPMFLPVIDLFVEDLGRASGIADAFTRASQDAALEAGLEVGEEESLGDTFEESLSISTARKGAKKNPSQKKSVGKSIAIDLVPKTQIDMKSINEFHPRLQYLKRARDKHELQDMYKHYTTGQLPQKMKGGKFKWRGKIYNSKKQVQEAVSKTGTQVDKGHQAMSILYARRKDNGNLVPHRIILPRIMVKYDEKTGKMTANKGSKHSKDTAKLLKQIENDFGQITFVKNLNDFGGQTAKGKDKRGKPKEYNYNRGVGKLFKVKGLDYDGANLFVSQVALNGVMHYEGRMPGGKSTGQLALAGGATV